MAKFERTFCSQCGGEFGPGDCGFSHCIDHAGRVDTDDDALDWEEFQGMSEDQIDALHDRLLKEYSDNLDRMTPRQLYEHHRRRRLDLCRRQRRLIRQMPYMDVFREMLRKTQRRLVEQRIEYRTGAQAGHA